MQCNDCGGTLAVKGTPDEPDIICNHCDPRGPVRKYQKNLTYFRTAKLDIKVDRKWLTDDNENEEAEGWKEIQERITQAIRYAYGRHPAVPQIEWMEWDGEPETD